MERPQSRWSHIVEDSIFGKNPPSEKFLTPSRPRPPVPCVVRQAPRSFLFAGQQVGHRAVQHLCSYVMYIASFVPASSSEPDETGNTLQSGFDALGIISDAENNNSTLERGDCPPPWLFRVVCNPQDESSFEAAVCASLRTNTAQDEENRDARKGTTTVSLFVGEMARYSGIFPGCVVRIVGDVLRRDRNRNVTQVSVKNIILPSVPCYPWKKRSLENEKVDGGPTYHPSGMPYRVQYVCGPYPNGELFFDFIESVLRCAISREVDLLILGGPFAVGYLPSEHAVPANRTSHCLLDVFACLVDKIEETIHPVHHRLQVVVCSSIHDAQVFPVLPQRPIVPKPTGTVCQAVGNPCLLQVGPLLLSLINHDVLDDVKEHLVEHGFDKSNREYRCLDSVMRCRHVLPLLSLPSPTVDCAGISLMRLHDEMEVNQPHLFFSSTRSGTSGAYLTSAGQEDGDANSDRHGLLACVVRHNDAEKLHRQYEPVKSEQQPPRNNLNSISKVQPFEGVEFDTLEVTIRDVASIVAEGPNVDNSVVKVIKTVRTQ